MNPRLRANVPVGVDYGTVTGEFVSFVGDGMTNPPDGTPDEVPLQGYVIFTPSVQTMRWPTLVPPKTAVIATVRCPVIEGVLYAPGTSPDDLGDHGVALVASKQPNALPDLVQYIVSFELEGAKTQPPSFRIEVPTNGSVDLSTVIPSGPTSGAVTIVSTEDRERAEAAATAAQADAATATAKATAAAASATAAKSSETAAEAARTAVDAVAAQVPRNLTAADTPESLTSGIYFRTNKAHLESWLPVTASGTLIVYRNGAEGMAIFFPREGSSSLMRFCTYGGGSWGAWLVMKQNQDTGWRDISSSLEEGVTLHETGGRVRLRRIGQQVFVVARLRVTDAVGLFSLPSGFRSPYNYQSVALATPSGGNVFQEAQKLRLDTARTGAVVMTFSYLTDDQWPTELPGTPA